MAPPRCTIKPLGTTISVTASVTISLVPPNLPEVHLSTMIMVRALEWGSWGEGINGKWLWIFGVHNILHTSPQEARLSAKMALRGKALRTRLDLRRYADGQRSWAGP
jgi:phospholipid transfer protein